MKLALIPVLAVVLLGAAALTARPAAADVVCIRDAVTYDAPPALAAYLVQSGQATVGACANPVPLPPYAPPAPPAPPPPAPHTPHPFQGPGPMYIELFP